MKKHWTLTVFILTLILAIVFSFIANFLGNFNNIVLIVCLISIILIGIVFDIIGTAALSCNEKVLHSRASQKMKGAKKAISICKNASSVSSFCNDVVGDVCGILSGSLVTILVINLFSNSDISLWNVIMASLLSSLTVGGKAIGKKIAIKYADNIIYNVGKFLTIFSFK